MSGKKKCKPNPNPVTPSSLVPLTSCAAVAPAVAAPPPLCPRIPVPRRRGHGSPYPACCHCRLHPAGPPPQPSSTLSLLQPSSVRPPRPSSAPAPPMKKWWHDMGRHPTVSSIVKIVCVSSSVQPHGIRMAEFVASNSPWMSASTFLREGPFAR